LEQADPTVVSARGYLGAATSIAIELDHPAYAAVYLAAAEAHDLRYVTADSRLVRKVRDRNNRFQQMLVPLSDTA
jgi:predicted nucleic acid-binding protein